MTTSTDRFGVTFRVVTEQWTEGDDGRMLRTILEVADVKGTLPPNGNRYTVEEFGGTSFDEVFEI